jgi:hypothetical protein
MPIGIGAVAEHSSAGGHPSRGAGHRVFHDGATPRVHAQRLRSGQVHVRIGLAARHFVAAEDPLAKAVGNADLGQLQLHLAAVRARGHGDAAVQGHVQGPHRVRRAGDLDQVAVQRGIAALAELIEPIRRDRGARARFDQRQFVPDGLAREDLHGFRMRDAPAQLIEHVGQHAAGDGFGIDQDAVAVEQHGIEGKISHCSNVGNVHEAGKHTAGLLRNAGGSPGIKFRQT